MNGPEILYRYRGGIEAEVIDFLKDGQSQVDEMLRYQMGWSDGELTNLGKCLRPTFCLLANEALGGTPRQTLPIAVGIEFVHNFSLIHDDIEDGDDIRHHRPTVWRAFGRDPAILGGLALWNQAYRIMNVAVDRGLPLERVLEARRILNEACSEIIEGQHQDLSFESRSDVSLAEYVQMIGRKSAALFGTSLRLGALAAGADSEEADRFDAYGRQLGLAFQIRDDILGIWGEGSATGKPVGADIARKKKTLPVLHAFEQAVGKDRALLLDVYGGETVDDGDVNDVLEILQRWNCRYFAQGLAEDYRSKAMDALSKTNIPWEFRLDFDALTGFILERDY